MDDTGTMKRFIALVLFEMKKAGATELEMAPAKGDEIPMRYKAQGQWHDLASPPASIRPAVVAELGRMANLPDAQFPKVGIIDALVDGVQTKWRLKADSAEAKVVLTPG